MARAPATDGNSHANGVPDSDGYPNRHPHANGDRNHRDCEDGIVSSKNDKYVFVKFIEQIRKLGMTHRKRARQSYWLRYESF